MAEREAALLAAPIRSEVDLWRHNAEMPSSPLRRLSPAARRQFMESLTFNEKGVTSFRYDVLEDELTPTEAFAVLSLLGIQHTVPMLDAAEPKTSLDRALMRPTPSFGHDEITDHKMYRCESRGTCVGDNDRICTSNC